MKFSWQPVTDAGEWDRLVERSAQGTLFSERLYLDLAGVPYDLYLICQGRQTKAGVCVIRTADGSGCRLDDLVIHNGIMFLPDRTKKAVRQRFEQFELTEFAVAELSRRYDPIELALAPQFEDLRPFLWYNYHSGNPDKKFSLDLRYTTYVDLSELAGHEQSPMESATFRAMETLRQRHVREAAKKGGGARRGDSSAVLVGYYRELMTRQGEPAAEDKLSRIARMVDGLIASKRCAVYEVLNHEGTVVYVVAYGWDSKRAYYLFGAGHPEVSEPWQGTFAHWFAFTDLAQRLGMIEADMEGVNSPQRGWFKMGFGGDLHTYFHAIKCGKDSNASR